MLETPAEKGERLAKFGPPSGVCGVHLDLRGKERDVEARRNPRRFGPLLQTNWRGVRVPMRPIAEFQAQCPRGAVAVEALHLRHSYGRTKNWPVEASCTPLNIRGLSLCIHQTSTFAIPSLLPAKELETQQANEALEFFEITLSVPRSFGCNSGTAPFSHQGSIHHSAAPLRQIRINCSPKFMRGSIFCGRFAISAITCTKCDRDF